MAGDTMPQENQYIVQDAAKRAVTNNFMKENQTLSHNSPDFSLLDDLDLG
jgi:hypothetical protein